METLRSASETRPATRNRLRSMPSVDTRRQPPTGSMVQCACAPEIKRAHSKAALCSRTEQTRIRQLYSASSHPPAARMACFDHSAHPGELAMPATADIRCEAPVEQSRADAIHLGEIWTSVRAGAGECERAHVHARAHTVPTAQLKLKAPASSSSAVQAALPITACGCRMHIRIEERLHCTHKISRCVRKSDGSNRRKTGSSPSL